MQSAGPRFAGTVLRPRLTRPHHACSPGPVGTSLGRNMKLTVNFTEESHEEPELSVAGLIAKKRWTFPLIIARVNDVLVERRDYASTPLVDGDRVELYHLVSGG